MFRSVLIIVAGAGRLPHLLIRQAKQLNLNFFVVCEKNFYQPKYEPLFDSVLSESKKFFGNGWKILPRIVFFRLWFPFRHIRLIAVGKFFKMSRNTATFRALRNYSDHQILESLVFGFKLLKIRITSPLFVLSKDCTEKGLLSGSISDVDKGLVPYYLEESRKLLSSDVGQSVFFMKKNPIAVEGAEGTDRAIRRVGLMVGPGWVLVKMKKPHQTVELDMPVVGCDTIRSVYRYQGKGLIVDASNVLFVDKEATLRLAHQLGIFIYGAE